MTIPLIFFLISCGHTIPIVPPDQKVDIAAEALESCPKLSETVVVTSFEDSIVAYGDLATNYGKCANKQNTSIKLIKQLGNIK